jgi:hypothetical protein
LYRPAAKPSPRPADSRAAPPAPGFEGTTFERSYKNKEKEVDVAISTQLMEDSYEHMNADRAVLGKAGPAKTVVFWEHATARDLRAAADAFVALDPLFLHLTR